METIGPYRIERRLGSGGMGVVYAARDAALDRPVALKVISPQLAGDPAFRERFTREARAQAALDSEHVVRVYAHGEDDGRLWIASQLVPDGDLGQLLRQYGAPPRPVATDLIAQVASGLADAHAAGLVHRDIKPANVLLRRGPRIRAYLADFGVAGPAGGAPDGAGTPAYMAPELSAGAPAGVASDVYSLGCLLWATLTGRPPRPLAPPPQLEGGDPLNPVLRIALAPRPEDRYPSAAAFGAALEAASRAERRRRWGVVGPAVAAVVLVAGVGTVWALARSDEEPADPPGASGTSGTAVVELEERGAAELADSLGASLNDRQAECVADLVVDDLGFDALVEAGFFDDEGHFLDPDLAEHAEIKESLTRAAQSCAG